MKISRKFARLTAVFLLTVFFSIMANDNAVAFGEADQSMHSYKTSSTEMIQAGEPALAAVGLAVLGVSAVVAVGAFAFGVADGYLNGGALQPYNQLAYEYHDANDFSSFDM